jgi:hypothetical protein
VHSYHVELGSGVLATPDQQHLLAARVLGQKRRNVENVAVDNNLKNALDMKNQSRKLHWVVMRV